MADDRKPKTSHSMTFQSEGIDKNGLYIFDVAFDSIIVRMYFDQQTLLSLITTGTNLVFNSRKNGLKQNVRIVLTKGWGYPLESENYCSLVLEDKAYKTIIKAYKIIISKDHIEQLTKLGVEVVDMYNYTRRQDAELRGEAKKSIYS